MDDRLLDWGLPSYAKPGDAGMDVRAFVDEPTEILPGDVKLIPLGFAMHINNEFLVAHLMPRSGKGHKEGIVLGNLVGTIDSEYQGQVFASVWNRNRNTTVTIKPGEKIAQLIFSPIVRAEWEVVSGFKKSERGEGGFGHTDKQ